MSGIVRDFSLSSIEHLREIIRKNVEEDGELFLVDWVKDWFMDDLNIEDYINDIDTYHANMVDKYDISYKKFDEILNKVHAVDISYADRFNSIYEGLSSFNAKIMNVTAIIDPSAVTLDENVYEELLDGLETLYTNDLTKVKNTIDNDESELNEALREVPWYESALDFVAGAGVELVKNNLEGLVFIPYAIVDGIFGTNLNENLDLLLNNAEEKYILPHIGNKQAYYYGKATGDVITMIEGAYGIAKGLFKIVSGLGLAGGGFVLEASGVGAIFGAAAQAVSIPLVVAGTAEMSLALAVAAEGYGNLNDNMMMASSSSNINDSTRSKQKDLDSNLKEIKKVSKSSSRLSGKEVELKWLSDNYKAVEVKGTVKVNGETRDVSRRVYQTEIDWDYVPKDPQANGLSNKQLASKGRSPYAVDKNGVEAKIELHHLTQLEAGSMVEIAATTHDEYTKILHGIVENGGSFRNNEILDKQYSNFLKKYWRWRAKNL